MVMIARQKYKVILKMSKEELTALKKQMLLNILSAEKSIFIHYKNKQLTKDNKNVKQIRDMATNSSI
jgi:hypothetical protein